MALREVETHAVDCVSGVRRAQRSVAGDISQVIAPELVVERDVNDEVSVPPKVDVLEHQMSLPSRRCQIRRVSDLRAVVEPCIESRPLSGWHCPARMGRNAFWMCCLTVDQLKVGESDVVGEGCV
jgi:hypothetical protein